MLTRLKSYLSRFRRGEDGTIAAEAALMFPLLLWAVLASYVYFEAFRNQSVNTKAAYTISDALSRETDFISNTYMNSIWRLHQFLTNSERDTKLRVSLVQYNADDDEYRIVWSRARGGVSAYSDDSRISNPNLLAQLPVMPHIETVIMVQTWVTHEPVFSIGLDAFEFENMILTRPRFAPNGICYSHNDTPSGAICPINS